MVAERMRNKSKCGRENCTMLNWGIFMKNMIKKVLYAVFMILLIFTVNISASAIDIDEDSDVKLIRIIDSREELLSYYHAFLATLPQGYSDTAALTPENTEAFIDYAVTQGLIADSETERNAVTKAIVRAEFEAVVLAGRVAGLTTAADFLDHSLQDNPGVLSFAPGSESSNQILNSAEGREIIAEFKSYVIGTEYQACNTNGTITLDSTTDLHLAYNQVYYNVQGIKSNGQWKLTITITDEYDFDHQPWENAMTDNLAVTALNNYAAYAESIGAIVPFYIRVVLTTSFRL